MMNRRNFLGGLVLGGLVLAAGATSATAQRDYYGGDRYRDRYGDRYGGRYGSDPWNYRGQSYYRGRNSDDIRRREALRYRLFDLADQVRSAESRGLITRRRSDDLRGRLDDVRDFLRDDRNLTHSEFDRRRDDLDDIAEDLRDAYRRRGGSYSRDPWFGRYDSRYRSNSRYNRY